jgi:outer membrane biosynthesis protein TonB
MLQPLVSTPPNDFRRPGVLLLSVTVHALLVYAAFTRHIVTGTASGDVPRPVERPAIVEQIRYLTIAPVVKAPPVEKLAEKALAAPPEAMQAPPPAHTERNSRSLSRIPRLRAPVIGPISIADPTPVPDIDLSSKVSEIDTALIAAAPRVSSLVKGLVGDSASLAAHTGPYLRDEVDRVVRPYDNNPKPVYPWRLQRQGVQASFVAQFVIDSTGRVDESSLVFPPGAHSLFVEAVRQALHKSRYFPAEFGGRKVNQLVEQRFTFVLVSGRGEYR